MYLDTADQLSSRRRDAAVNAAFDCNAEVFDGITKVVELNIQTVKTSLSEQQAMADAALSAQSLSAVIDLQSRQFPAAVKKTFAYWRHVEDIAVQTGIGLFTAMQTHVGSVLTTFADMADVAPGTAATQEGLGKWSVFVTGQPAVDPAQPGGIVDSSGNAVSSAEVRGDLH
ncbi:phasin [Burkholderia sp. SG-MS1]|uniref:phasin family protein n=1 Tax=Paraburkholderia sp. SG-MS1 TaxID=2023741 RepID=UPI0014460603|nr:phasin family protein [Paraburkholderia sp. SG-MS1]NKJ50829.1 phasin [Paraburkholderia sp. SG-MS1]